MFKLNQCISWKRIASKAKTSWYTKLRLVEIEKIERWLYNISTGTSFLAVYLSLLNPSLCNIASEEIVLTQTNILFLSEFTLMGVSLNSNIRQVELFSLVPWRFELPGVNRSL